MRSLVLLVILIAGCSSPTSPAAPAEPPEPAVALPPDALDLRAAADEEARAWHPEARLSLVAMFEGDIPAWGGGREDPWVGPYFDLEGTLGDGRSELWSFSYALDDIVHDAATAICGTGAHAEVREAHVVTVDGDGNIVASYETRNDDEGAVIGGFLPDEFLSSAEAASIAAARTAKDAWAYDAVWARTFLMTDWYSPGPMWAFIFDIADFDRRFVGVHAVTGEVVAEGAPPGPPC